MEDSHVLDSIRQSIYNICDKESKKLGLEISIEAIVEQLSKLSSDLMSFSSHAKRNVITSDDVILCARNCEDLHKHLKIINETEENKN